MGKLRVIWVWSRPNVILSKTTNYKTIQTALAGGRTVTANQMVISQICVIGLSVLDRFNVTRLLMHHNVINGCIYGSRLVIGSLISTVAGSKLADVNLRVDSFGRLTLRQRETNRSIVIQGKMKINSFAQFVFRLSVGPLLLIYSNCHN